MRSLIQSLVFGAGLLAAPLAAVAPARAEEPIKVESKTADLGNGVELHYLVAGKGDPVILLHGFAQTSHMWLPLMPELAKTHLVIAPDLRGFGFSSKPEGGYDKKTMAEDIHALVT